MYPVDENQQEERKNDGDDGDEEQSVEMFVMLLSTLFRTTAGMRHPIVPSFETLKEDGALTEYEYVPPTSTIIYVSHEWTGNDHSDPRGDQMYHLVLLLERLLNGEVSRTEMHWFHNLVYKHNYSTTAEDWKLMLDPQKTYIFYDGFCVSKEKRDQTFRMIPEFIKRSDFMIILAPGCT